MELVRIFTGQWDDPSRGFASLEKEVNKWLNQDTGIRIIQRSMSSFFGADPCAVTGRVGCTIVIFYEDPMATFPSE